VAFAVSVDGKQKLATIKFEYSQRWHDGQERGWMTCLSIENAIVLRKALDAAIEVAEENEDD
jgi:hypothetical protein